MSKFRALFGLQFKAMLYSFQMGGKRKKKGFTGAGTLIVMGILALYLSGVYSFLFASQLATVGMLPLLIMMMSVMAVVLGFFFTVFAAQGVVFSGRDNDLMLSMPVSPFALMLARVLALYVENVVFCVFVMLPAGVAYLFYGGGGGLWFVPALLLGTVLMALLPTLLALVAGFLLSWISSKFARKNLISIFLYGLLMAGVFLLVFRMNYFMQDLALVAAGVEQAFIGWGLPFLLLKEAACDGRVLSLVLLAALCILPFLLCVWLFAPHYKKIITGLQSHRGRSDYKLGMVRSGNQRSALLRKEAAKFFGTPIYLFNSGIGLIMLLVMGVASLVQGDFIAGLLAEMTGQGVTLPILPLLVASVCFLLSMVGITASSISVEGRQIWILKSAPIDTRHLFAVKAGFQLMLALPCVLVASLCLWSAFALAVGDWLLLLVFGVTFSLFSAPFGLFINLCLPKLDAVSDMVAVKQSASAIVGIFGPMLLALVGGGLYLLTQSLWPCLLLVIVAAVAAWVALETKGATLFQAL